MRMVMAVIKPFKIDDVRDALTKLGVEGMTMTEVRGYGRQKGQTETSDDPESGYAVSFLSKIKLEVAIPKKLEKKVVKAIAAAANTGRIGDGKIFVYDLTQVVRIRTGESGDKAL